MLFEHWIGRCLLYVQTKKKFGIFMNVQIFVKQFSKIFCLEGALQKLIHYTLYSLQTYGNRPIPFGLEFSLHLKPGLLKLFDIHFAGLLSNGPTIERAYFNLGENSRTRNSIQLFRKTSKTWINLILMNVSLILTNRCFKKRAYYQEGLLQRPGLQ